MRVLIQRVSKSSVTVKKTCIGEIQKGLLVFLGIENNDTQEDAKWLCNKICNLRIFEDDKGVMNKSILDKNFELLVVSQFTLHASTKKGNRPSYIRSAPAQISKPLYEYFVKTLKNTSKLNIETGEFGADMKVSLINDGPVTIWIDSKNKE